MTTAPVWADRGRCKSEDEHKRKLIFDNCAPVSVASSPTVVATIDKSRSSQLRIRISQWRGKRRGEIREATATIPGIFFPTSAGVMLDIERCLISMLPCRRRKTLLAGGDGCDDKIKILRLS